MNLFTYGTLMDADIMSTVSGISCQSVTATLAGYERRRVREEVFPAIFRQDKSSVEGILYTDLPSTALQPLDFFEGSLYTRSEVIVQCENGEQLNAFAYVIAKRFQQRLAHHDWNFEHFLKHHKRTYLTR